MADEKDMSKQRFAEHLFWYLNGTLDPANRALVERYLAEHAEARKELENWQTLQLGLRTTAARRPAAAGLDSFMRSVQEHSQGGGSAAMERIAQWLRSLAARPALATAFALVLVQAGIIASLLARQPADVAQTLEEEVKTRSLGTSTAALLQVRFRPSATVGEVDALLDEIDGGLVDGPSEGYLTVRVAANPAAAMEKIKASGIVQDVIPVSGSQAPN